jgi:hypothetical protein
VRCETALHLARRNCRRICLGFLIGCRRPERVPGDRDESGDDCDRGGDEAPDDLRRRVEALPEAWLLHSLKDALPKHFTCVEVP